MVFATLGDNDKNNFLQNHKNNILYNNIDNKQYRYHYNTDKICSE